MDPRHLSSVAMAESLIQRDIELMDSLSDVDYASFLPVMDNGFVTHGRTAEGWQGPDEVGAEHLKQLDLQAAGGNDMESSDTESSSGGTPPLALAAAARTRIDLKLRAATPLTQAGSTCPICGKRPHRKGQAPDVLAVVGGDSMRHCGRYCVRDKPRKDNLLAMWNGKYGYAGQPYCKSCSESFRSHLLIRKCTPRSGCCREAPCAHCATILSFFNCDKEEAYRRFDAYKMERAAKRGTKQTTDACTQQHPKKQKPATKVPAEPPAPPPPVFAHCHAKSEIAQPLTAPPSRPGGVTTAAGGDHNTFRSPGLRLMMPPLPRQQEQEQEERQQVMRASKM